MQRGPSASLAWLPDFQSTVALHKSLLTVLGPSSTPKLLGRQTGCYTQLCLMGVLCGSVPQASCLAWPLQVRRGTPDGERRKRPSCRSERNLRCQNARQMRRLGICRVRLDPGDRLMPRFPGKRSSTGAAPSCSRLPLEERSLERAL